MITTVRLARQGTSMQENRALEANVRLSSLLASNFDVVMARQGSFRVRSIVPTRGHIEAEANTLPKAIGSLAEQISQVVLDAGSFDHWPPEWVQFLDDVPVHVPASQADEVTASARQRTKERNLSIGMSTSTALHDALEDRAQELETTVSQVARDLFLAGLSALNRSVEEEDLDTTFSEFRDNYLALNTGESLRWMLRVERRKYLEAQMLAKELSCSLAQLTGWCVQYALRTVPVRAET